jgi:hypothetical protein
MMASLSPHSLRVRPFGHTPRDCSLPPVPQSGQPARHFMLRAGDISPSIKVAVQSRITESFERGLEGRLELRVQLRPILRFRDPSRQTLIFDIFVIRESSIFEKSKPRRCDPDTVVL